MGQIIDRASSPAFISRTHKKLAASLGDWTVDTIIAASGAFLYDVGNVRGNFSIGFDEFVCLPFLYRHKCAPNEPASEDTIETVWALYCDGGEEDDEFDASGNVVRKNWNNVRVDALQMFSSLLWLLPRRGDDRQKLYACFKLFDLKGTNSLTKNDVLTLLSSVFGGLHICTEGFVLMPSIGSLTTVVDSVLEEKHVKERIRWGGAGPTDENGAIFEFSFIKLCYDELEQTSIEGILCAEGINRFGVHGELVEDRWEGTRSSWIESFLYASLDRKIFKAALFNAPDSEVKLRKTLPPLAPSEKEISEWYSVIESLVPGPFRSKMLDTDCKELDLSTERGLNDQRIELLTVYLTINNYKQLTSVNVAHCNLKASGARLVCDGLMLNQTVTHLNCAENAFGPDGAQSLATYLSGNTTLRFLNAGVNRIGAGGATQIANVLTHKRNTTLQTLDLRGNGAGQVGGVAFGESIGANHPSLTYLNLRDNGIDAVAGKAIAEGLRLNRTLTDFDVSKNALYDEGATAISKALTDAKGNTMLINLDLGYNNIKADGGEAVATMLSHNSTLTSVSLAANKLGFKYYDRPARKPVSDNVVQMMPHTYSTFGTSAMMRSIRGSSTLISMNLAMNHIDNAVGKILCSLLEREGNPSPGSISRINLNGNEMGEEIAAKLGKCPCSVDALNQVRMKTWSSAAMQTPVRVYAPTTDDSVGEGALTTHSLGRTRMRTVGTKRQDGTDAGGKEYKK
eukprot:g8137.t1